MSYRCYLRNCLDKKVKQSCKGNNRMKGGQLFLYVHVHASSPAESNVIKLKSHVGLVYVIAWFAVVFGINSTSNAESNCTRLRLV